MQSPAVDPYGNVATGYAGTVHFTSSDSKSTAGNSLPSDYTFTTGTGDDDGVHTFSATFKTAGTQSITATSTLTGSLASPRVTGSITGTQSGIVVNPAAASTLVISAYPSPTTSGAAQNFTVTAYDPYGNIATGYAGTIHFTSSDSKSTAGSGLPSDYTFTTGTGDDDGVHTFSATFKTAGTQSITTTDTVTGSITGTQSGIVVNPAAASTLVISAYPSPTTSGAAQNFTVTAYDPYGNIATGYAGTIHFTSSDSKSTAGNGLPSDYTFTTGTGDDDGVHTFSATFKTAGTQSITTTDTVTGSITGTQSGIVVNPAAASTSVAANDSYVPIENGTLTVAAPGILANDTGPQGYAITPVLATAPVHGTLTLNSDGSFAYTPTAGYYGPDSFTYQDEDPNGSLSNVATVSINVDALPVAVNDSYTTNENVTLTIATPGVFANDSDPQGNGYSPVIVTRPAHGNLTLYNNGAMTYIPTAGYSGPDSFTYQDKDGRGALSNVATVTLEVNFVSHAANDSYVPIENGTLTVAAPGILANDTGPQGYAITPVLATAPVHGTLTLNSDGSFAYTPTAGYYGPDSFTYQDEDPNGSLSNVATVSINVDALPVAVNDSYTTNENVTLTIATPGVFANDSDPQGNGYSPVIVTRPAHGNLTLYNNGAMTYIPTAGYSGPDSFTYQDKDGRGALSNVATVTLEVNFVSHAANDSYVPIENGTLTVAAPGILANDTGPQGYAITPVLATAPVHGTLTLNSDGSFAYTPTAGYYGPDSFTYQDEDPNGSLSNVATVSINVDALPVAVNDSYTTNENVTLTIATPGVFANDSDPQGNGYSPVIVTRPAHGNLTLYNNGAMTYIPTAGYSGPDSFTYQDKDGRGALSNVATVTLEVNFVSQPPVAADDSYVASISPVSITVDALAVADNDTFGAHSDDYRTCQPRDRRRRE